MIYDHIYGPFADEDAAKTAMRANKINYRGKPAVSVDEKGVKHWHMAHPIDMVTKEAVYENITMEKPAGHLLTARVTKYGFYVRMPSDKPTTKHKPLHETVKRGEVEKNGAIMSVVAA